MGSIAVRFVEQKVMIHIAIKTFVPESVERLFDVHTNPNGEHSIFNEENKEEIGRPDVVGVGDSYTIVITKKPK